MKIIILILTLLILSCNSKEIEVVKGYEYQVTIANDNWAWSCIYCDSFNMINQNEIIIYCNGTKQKIYAGKIRVNQNPYK